MLDNSLTIFENDVENQVEYYLTTAVLMAIFTRQEVYDSLQKLLQNNGLEEMPISIEQLRTWVKHSRNTANELQAETESGMFADPPRMVL